MSVSVLVPYRGDDGGPRDKAWAYVREWWGRHQPGWQVVEGACPPGPWVKARAVADALSRSDGDIILVADSDCVSVGVGRAVAEVEAGEARWAIPHRRVYRLTAAATARVLAGGPIPAPERGRPKVRNAAGRVREWQASSFDGIHTGAPGGGLVVLPRTLYEEVPLDPRFVQWGQDDLSFGDALTVIVGPPRRPGKRDPDTPCFHLWHDPPPRIRASEVQGGEMPWGRMDRAHGNPANMVLRARYRAAVRAGPEAMRALLAEIQHGPR